MTTNSDDQQSLRTTLKLSDTWMKKITDGMDDESVNTTGDQETVHFENVFGYMYNLFHKDVVKSD